MIENWSSWFYHILLKVYITLIFVKYRVSMLLRFLFEFYRDKL